MPHRLHIDVIGIKLYREDELGVTPIPVSHSVYPSHALVYNGHDKTVFYSGDLRVNGPLGPRVNIIQTIEKDLDFGSTDIALLEGANVGEIETPIGLEEFRSL
ncbi:MAG: hypothetical protein F7C07_00415 [Desulfurococcales archaeon]|nr:hypothetical protein [Desulfurococcales archaeon]